MHRFIDGFRALIGPLRRLVTLGCFATGTLLAGEPGGEQAKTFEIGAVPAWVELVSWDGAIRPPRGGDPVHILVSDQQDLMTPDGADFFYRFVVHLLNAEGVRQYAEQAIVYAPEYERVTWHTLRLKRGEEVLDRLPAAQFRKMQRELGLEANVLTGLTTVAAVLDDVRVGDVLEVAYTMRSANPLLKGHMSARHYFGSAFPIERQRVVIRTPLSSPEPFCSFYLPPGTRNLPGDLYRPAALKLALQVSESGEWRVYLWEGTALPAIVFDQNIPVQAAPYYPEFQVTSFRTWADVVDWAVPIFASSAELPPTARMLLEQWRRDHATPAARLGAAVHWVQNEVRYFSMAVGVHNLRPRPLRDVCATRFGDCKDKSLLLAALLRELGFEAWPALVSSHLGAGILQHAPGPFAFDHAIVAYRFGGSLCWLDPTLKGQKGPPGGWALPPYRAALILREGESELTNIAPRDDVLPDVETSDVFTIDEVSGDAALGTQVTLRALQADLYRQSLESTTAAEIGTRWFNFISRFYKTLDEIAAPMVEDDPVANRIVIRARYRLPGFLHTERGEQTVSVYAYALRGLLDPPESRRRRWPYALPGSRFVRQRIEIALPFDVPMDQQPEVIVTDGIDYRVEKGLAERKFTAVHDLRIVDDFVAAGRMDGFCDAVDEILTAMSTTLRHRLAKPEAATPTDPEKPPAR